jgi:peptidoglycan/LPS O-acetylase OafA/YrhL
VRPDHRFLTLDAMRGVAAAVVMMIHMGGAPARALPGGYLAVDFFFALSGFVLAHAYGERSLGVVGFLTARGIRLYPLYLAGLVLGVGAAALTGMAPRQLLTALGLGLFFLPAPGVDLYPLNPPAWSLFLELVANAAWFPLRQWLRGPAAVAVLLLGCLAVIAADVAYGAISSGGYWSNVAGGLARVLFAFTAGVATYQVWRAPIARPALPSWVVVVALLAIFAIPGPRKVLDPLAVLAMPVVVYLGACCMPCGTLNLAVQSKLGTASYGIYALHFPTVVAIDALLIGPLRRAGLPHPSLVTTPFTLALVFAGALLLDRIYDWPLRRWLSLRSMAASSVVQKTIAPNIAGTAKPD